MGESVEKVNVWECWVKKTKRENKLWIDYFLLYAHAESTYSVHFLLKVYVREGINNVYALKKSKKDKKSMVISFI